MLDVLVTEGEDNSNVLRCVVKVDVLYHIRLLQKGKVLEFYRVFVTHCIFKKLRTKLVKHVLTTIWALRIIFQAYSISILIFFPKIKVHQASESKVKSCSFLVDQDLLQLELNPRPVFFCRFIFISWLFSCTKLELDFLDQKLWKRIDIVLNLEPIMKIKFDFIAIPKFDGHPLSNDFVFFV